MFDFFVSPLVQSSLPCCALSEFGCEPIGNLTCLRLVRQHLPTQWQMPAEGGLGPSIGGAWVP